MPKFLSIALVTLLLTPVLVNADSSSWCKPYPFLMGGFNMVSYNQCQMSIHKCPTQGPYLDQSCITQVVTKNTACRQLQSLGNAIQASAEMISIKPVGKFSIVTINFPADGQEQNYLMSPQGCLADTSVDPRKLDAMLAKQYQSSSFMIVNWGAPSYQTNADGTYSFTALSRITDKCLACALIGWVKLKFDFTHAGKPLAASVVSFSKEKPVMNKANS